LAARRPAARRAGRRIGAVAGLLLATFTGAPAGAQQEDVVLLHGLGRSARTMRPIERDLAAAGYRVHSLDYPSTRATPDRLVAHLEAAIGQCCADADPLHFVTHSLGGIVARAYLAEHRPPHLGRIVMLAPPNHGSEYVDVAGGWKLFERLLGPTATQLGTSPNSLPNRLPAADFELGVVAGTGGFNPIGAALIAGESDGTVSVASTRLHGMSDFVAIDVSHTFIMRNDEVAAQTIAFLREGRFQCRVHAPFRHSRPAGTFARR
jgi:pimeloyl-ACP methyl ester carboxylesterase